MPKASVARGDRWRATPAPARRIVPGLLLDRFALVRALPWDRLPLLDRSLPRDRVLDLDFVLAAMSAQTSITTGMMIGLR